MQPAARRDENIAADFQAIREVDGHMPRDLKIFPAAFEGRPQQESAQSQDRPQIGQPACGNTDEMKPKILEDSHCAAPIPAEPPLFPQTRQNSVL
jgi:hypothetical protein